MKGDRKRLRFFFELRKAETWYLHYMPLQRFPCVSILWEVKQQCQNVAGCWLLQCKDLWQCTRSVQCDVRVSLSTGLWPSKVRSWAHLSYSCTPECWKKTQLQSYIPYLENFELLLILDFCMEESYIVVVSPLLKCWNLAWTLNPSYLCTTRHASHVNLCMLALYTRLRHQFDPSKTFSSSAAMSRKLTPAEAVWLNDRSST
jgi:hypothetical protein